MRTHESNGHPSHPHPYPNRFPPPPPPTHEHRSTFGLGHDHEHEHEASPTIKVWAPTTSPVDSRRRRGTSGRVACDRCIASRHRCELEPSVPRDKEWVFEHKPQCAGCKAAHTPCSWGDKAKRERQVWTSLGGLAIMGARLDRIERLVDDAIARTRQRTLPTSATRSSAPIIPSQQPPPAFSVETPAPPPTSIPRLAADDSGRSDAREARFLLDQAMGLFELAWLYAPLAPEPPRTSCAKKIEAPEQTVDWSRPPNDQDLAKAMERTAKEMEHIQRASEIHEDPSNSECLPIPAPASPPQIVLDDRRQTAPLPRRQRARQLSNPTPEARPRKDIESTPSLPRVPFYPLDPPSPPLAPSYPSFPLGGPPRRSKSRPLIISRSKNSVSKSRNPRPFAPTSSFEEREKSKKPIGRRRTRGGVAAASEASTS